jgi:hypothetical protein
LDRFELAGLHRLTGNSRWWADNAKTASASRETLKKLSRSGELATLSKLKPCEVSVKIPVFELFNYFFKIFFTNAQLTCSHA